MDQSELFRPPLHHFVADTLAAQAKAEIRLMALRAMHEFDETARHILAFHHRSIAQRRRFLRLRILQERAS